MWQACCARAYLVRWRVMYRREIPQFDEAMKNLSNAGFEIASTPGIQGRLVKKYGCGAGVECSKSCQIKRLYSSPRMKSWSA